jgi:peptide/nickel transport system substrate-binding protein
MMLPATPRPSIFPTRPSREAIKTRSVRRIQLSILFLVAATVTGCGERGQGREGTRADSAVPAPAGGEDETPTDGDWLVYGHTTEPSSLDCARTTELTGRRLCRLVADSLIDYDRQNAFVPRLARSFERSADGLKVTFQLRDGVRWHDGRPFTAADVLHTVDVARRVDPSGENFNTSFGTLADLSAPDDLTVVAAYSSPYAGALRGWRDTFIIPAHVVYDPEKDPPMARAPVGTGPFRFVDWIPQTRITLEANLDYFGGRPHLDRIIYRIIPNAEALRAAAEASTVDVAGLPPGWLEAHPDPEPDLPFRPISYPVSGMEMIYWNLREPRGLFADRRVRLAMTMLLDRQGYASRIQKGIYSPAAVLIDPRLWGGDALEPHPYDPAGAARLLDEAGIVDRDGDGIRDARSGPMSFTFLYANVTPGHRELGELFERAAAAAGVRVRLQGLEWSVMKPRIHGGDFEAAITRWMIEPLPDPFAYFHSSQIGRNGFNLGGFADAEFDRLSEYFRNVLDPDRAAELLVRMQKILHEEQPCTFVAIPGALIAVHKRLHLPEPTVTGLFDWYPSVLTWWVAADERKYP